MGILDATLCYANLGWSVVPVGRDKIPYCRWRHYARHAATERKLREWWRAWPWANVALVTGEISGVTVIDVDPRNGGELPSLPATPLARTGGGGYHAFVRYQKTRGGWSGVDIKSDGGMVVLAPSIHQSGRSYEWLVSPWDMPLAEVSLPTPPAKSTPPERWSGGQRAIDEGLRNVTLFKIACAMRGRGEDEETIWGELMGVNVSRCQPPLSDKDIERIVRSLMRYPAGR
jgi:putative DNA primase/helicase